MEQKILPVIFSANSIESLESIFKYGAEIFSPTLALKFVSDLKRSLDELSSKYMQHAECRFLPTKSKKYGCLLLFPIQLYTGLWMSVLKY